MDYPYSISGSSFVKDKATGHAEASLIRTVFFIYFYDYLWHFKSQNEYVTYVTINKIFLFELVSLYRVQKIFF